MYFAQSISCPVCEALVPFSEQEQATCLFCFHQFQVPTHVHQPVAENSSLDRELGKAVAQVHRLKSMDKNKRWVFVALTAITVGPFLLSIPAYITEGFFRVPEAIFSVAFVGLFALITPTVLVISHLRGRRIALRHLAALPPVQIHLSDGLLPHCPECGAVVQVIKTSIKTKCAHCSTEALLPSHLVDDVLLKKYRGVAAVRQKGTAIQKEMDRRETSVPTYAVVLIIFGVLGVAGLLALTLSTAPEKLHYMIASMSFVGGIFINLGIFPLVKESKTRCLITGIVYISFGLCTAFLLLQHYPVVELIPAFIFGGIFVLGFGIFLLIYGSRKQSGHLGEEAPKAFCPFCGKQLPQATARTCSRCGGNWQTDSI